MVNVCEPVRVVTVESIAISLAFAVIPVPPTTVIVTSPLVPPPVRPSPATTEVISPTGLASTYAFTAADVGKVVSLSFEPIPSLAIIIFEASKFVKSKSLAEPPPYSNHSV